MRLYLFAALVLSLGVGITASLGLHTDENFITNPKKREYCATDFLHQKALVEDEAYAKRHQQLEDLAYQNTDKRNPPPPPYVLPVVFHIIHETGPEDLPDADILQSLDYLNQAFANEVYYDQGTGTPTQIQFCLAKRTPDNTPTTGITRMISNLTDVNSPEDDIPLKNLIRWNPTEYINIWVVREICGLGLGCGVAGYAYLPGSHGGIHDGIVVEARWLDGNEAELGVLIHEMGHYLGLYHTFQGGCPNADCLLNGDRVCDTPPDQSQVSAPCTGTVNSCNTDTDSGFAMDQNDMFNNYMDYGYFTCYNAFTPGQRDRMHFFIEGARASLLNSPACLDPCPNPVVANFSGGDISIEVGSTLNFSNLSVNADTYNWQVDGTSFATTTDAAYTFNTLGTFTITLQANSVDDRCISQRLSQTVTVTCPIEAIFAGPFTGIAPGDQVTFTNASLNANVYDWLLDGASVSTATDLVYTFNETGLFTVCLDAGNGLCNDETCRNIIVSSAVDTSDCGSTFAYYYAGFTDATFISITTDGTDYYVGGSIGNNPLVARLNIQGEVVWAQEIFPAVANGVIRDVKIDSDGMLMGLGRAFEPGSNNAQSYAFRINPLNGNILWIRAYDQANAEVHLTTILQAVPGGDYYLMGEINTPGANGCDATILSVDPSTGNQALIQRHYQLGSCETIYAAAYADDILYVAGRYNFAAGGTNRMRASITSFDLDANPIWSRLYLRNVNTNARMYGTDIVVNGNSLVMVAHGDENGTQSTTNSIFLLRTNLAGGSMFGKRIIMPTPTISHEVKVLTDGYLVLANSTTSNLQYLIKFDLAGNLVWARSFADFMARSISGDKLIVEDDHIILASALAGAAQFPVFLRLDLEGMPTEGCLAVATPDIVVEDIISPYDGFHQLSVYDLPYLESELSAETTQLELLEESCPLDCEEEEICDNSIDDDGDGLIDCDDPDIRNDCCCKSTPPLELGPDTTLCAGVDLLLELGVDFVDYQWSDNSQGQELVATAPGVYSVTVTDSCGIVLADTIRLSLRSVPTLDLGPDVTVCDNAVVPLDAGPDFATYEWVDGGTESFFTANDAGEFWVIATDSCGGIQSDTVYVEIDPITLIDLGADTTICLNDTLSFSVDGYLNYQWFPRELVDCDDCPAVRFTTDQDTTLILVAELSLGCISTDTIRVSVGQGIGESDTTALCMGDTITFANQVITTGGLYLDESQMAECAVPDTLLVILSNSTQTEEQIRICEGDSVLIFDTFEQLAGTYTRSFMNAQMCDSTHMVSLAVDPSYNSQEVITICPGESTIIFGEEESEAGFYFSDNTTQAGCDSNLVVQLIVTALNLEVQQARRTCTGEAVGVAAALASDGTAPYTYLWSNGETTQIIENLSIGPYSVTVTDDSGCVVVGSVNIEAFQAGDISLESQAVSCAGDMDGLILINDPNQAFSYSLDGQQFQSEPSFFGLGAGTYEVWARDSNNCEIRTLVDVVDGPSINISLPSEQELLLGDSITLVPTTNAGLGSIFVWQSSDGQSCRDCPDFTIAPSATTQVTVEVMDPNGCTAEATTLLRVNRDRLFYVPNAFSPNGDGINDRFTVFAGASVVRVQQLAIFGRWGEMVFDAKDFAPNDIRAGWDGRFRETELNAGVFVYHLELELRNGEVIQAAGDLILLR